MKKLFRNFALCALVAGTFTACHNGESVEQETIAVNYTSLNKIVVRSNTAATFTYGTATQTGTEATFETSSTTGTVTVAAAGKRTVTLNFDFNGGSYLEYEANLVTASDPVLAATAEAAGAADVANSSANAGDNDGVTASFNVAGNSNTGSSAGQDYSVTVFTPTDVNTSNVANNDNINESALALDCQPDGAQFANPVPVKVNVAGSNDFEFDAKNGTEVVPATVNGNAIQFNVTHFSVWEIILKAASTSTKETKTYTAEADASTGVLAYNFKYGYEASGESNPLVVNFLKKLFGITAKDITKKIKFGAVQDGTAKLTFTQDVTTYNFKSGNKTFTAKVYGTVKEGNLSITAPADVIRTHSGGSSQN